MSCRLLIFLPLVQFQPLGLLLLKILQDYLLTPFRVDQSSSTTHSHTRGPWFSWLLCTMSNLSYCARFCSLVHSMHTVRCASPAFNAKHHSLHNFVLHTLPMSTCLLHRYTCRPGCPRVVYTAPFLHIGLAESVLKKKTQRNGFSWLIQCFLYSLTMESDPKAWLSVMKSHAMYQANS